MGSLLLALLVGAPGWAAAQSPVASNARLYEVTEAMKIKGGGSGRRVATAALVGTVDAGTSVCPAALASALNVAECSLVAFATDNINLGTGRGPVHATFKVVIQDTNQADGPEFVILQGSLQGTIDLAPAVLAGVPLGTITGRWSAQSQWAGIFPLLLPKVRTHGAVTGTFRLPFCLSGTPQCLPELAAYMLKPDTFPAPDSFELVQPNEVSRGLPTVRLEIDFVEEP